MRKARVSLLGLSLAVMAATNVSVADTPAPAVTPTAPKPAVVSVTVAPKKLGIGHFVVFLAPQAAGSTLISYRRPVRFPCVLNMSGNNVVIGGKNAPQVVGTLQGDTFIGTDSRGITLTGKVSASSKIAALSGNFVAKDPKGTTAVTGTFAIVPFSVLGGRLMGGGPKTLSGIGEGWGPGATQMTGFGMGGWGYTGPGLFSGPESANLGGSTASGANSSDGDSLILGFVKWVTGAGSGGSGSVANAYQAVADRNAAINDAISKDFPPDDDTGASSNNTPDDRQVYGAAGLNGGKVTGGQDTNNNLTGANGGAASGLAVGPNRGDNPFEVTGGDVLNTSKLINGAKDPARP